MTDSLADKTKCPLCGGPNACGMAEGKTECWCFTATIAPGVLARPAAGGGAQPGLRLQRLRIRQSSEAQAQDRAVNSARDRYFGFRVGDLDVDLELHLLADGDAARLEHGVEVHAEVLAIDACPSAEARDGLAVGVLRRAEELHVERDRLRDAADRQVPVDDVLALALRLDPRALERDLRVIRDVEEVVRAEVIVAIRVAGVDARDVDLALERRVARSPWDRASPCPRSS